MKVPSSVSVLGSLVRTQRSVALFSALLVTLSYAPLLLLHVGRLAQNEHYQHLPLVLAAVCVLGWKRSRSAAAEPRHTFARARAVSRILGPLFLTVAVLLWSPWIAAVSAIIMIGGVVLGSGSRKLLTPVWLLLWLLIPLPFGWDNQLTSWLQGVSSRMGSTLLDLFEHDHLLAGHVIEVPGRQFMVEEACSGIRSVFVLVTCAAMFAVVTRRRWFHALALIVAAMLLAVATNVGRVVSVVMLTGDFAIDVTQGWRHDALGAVVFAVAVLLLMSVDQFLEFLFAPLPEFMDDDDIRPAKVKLVPAVADAALSRSGVGIAHTVPGWLAVLYGLLFVVQLPLLVSNEVQGSTLSLEQQEPLAGTSEASLPTEFDGWTHVSYELVTRESSSNYGTYSNTWTFRRESATAIVCLDYPFTGWHSLEQCYLGQGWSVRSWQLGTADQALDPLQQPFVQVELERPAGETALLLFSLFDREAQPLVAPPAEVSLVWSLGRLLARLDSTFAKLGLSNVPSPVPTTFPTYQFQTLVSKPHALTSEDRQRAIELFAGARSVVLKSWQTKP